MITAVILTVTFLAGALIGIQVLMRVGMNRERGRFLSNDPPTWISAAARFVSGLYVHMPDQPARTDLSHQPDRHPCRQQTPWSNDRTGRNGESE